MTTSKYFYGSPRRLGKSGHLHDIQLFSQPLTPEELQGLYLDNLQAEVPIRYTKWNTGDWIAFGVMVMFIVLMYLIVSNFVIGK